MSIATMQFEESSLGRDKQRLLVIHMALHVDVLRKARERLQLEDFDWELARVVARALFDYHDTYGGTPSPDVLTCEVGDIVSGKRGGFIPLPESEYGDLADLLADVAATRPESIQPDWALDLIGKYLAELKARRYHIQLGQALRSGIGIDEVIKAAPGALSVPGQDDEKDCFGDFCDPGVLSFDKDSVRHVPTGILKLDRAMAGGPMPGELVVIVACTGVGKTNAAINFQMNSCMAGWYNLFISGEMSAKNLCARGYAIGGHIPAVLFRERSISEMDAPVLARMDLMDRFRRTGRHKLYDLSRKTMTFARIEEGVLRWLAWLESIGKREMAGSVVIDYMDLISYAKESGLKDGDLSPSVLAAAMKQIKKEICNKHRLVAYVLAQGTGAADGKIVLRKGDIAWSKHTLDPAEIAFGISEPEDRRMQELANAGDDEFDSAAGSQVTVTGRELVIGFFKSRDGHQAAFRTYQSPTLKFYNSRSEYDNLDRLVREGRSDFLFSGLL